MKKTYISNDTESIRMFKNNFLESLSKVVFFVPLIIYVPFIAYLLWEAFAVWNMEALAFSGWLLVGVFVWTITEYIMHRFVFHFVPKSKLGLKIHFICHGVHHDYPNDAKRLVMPPSASIPLAAFFYFLFLWLLPDHTIYAFFTGFISGYLFYDMSHYALHHANFKNGFWKKLKRHHMLHHYSDPTRGYGVTSDLWDKIFNSNFLQK